MAKTTYLRLLVAVTAAVLAVTLLVLAKPVAAQTTPAGLGGEQFQSTDPTITSCNVDEFGGTFTYEASGVAVGPYPGTFTETGTVTVGPADAFLRQRITALSAQFTIDSPNGDVSGTKEFVAVGDPNVNTATGRCSQNFFTGQNEGSAFVFSDDLRYQATISTPDGQTCTQEGPSLLRLIEGSRVLTDEFAETFYNDLSNPVPTCEGGEEPPPEVPTSKEQCKDSDFASFGFKNQGECVAFVERGPKKAK